MVKQEDGEPGSPARGPWMIKIWRHGLPSVGYDLPKRLTVSITLCTLISGVWWDGGSF